MKKAISSRQNPLFRRIRDAIREHADEIAIEGPKQVSDAIAAGWKALVVVERAVVIPRRADGVIPSREDGEGSSTALREKLLRSAQDDTVPDDTVAFTHDLFDALAETRSPQNVIALFERPRATVEGILARRDTVAVALDGVQDPGNVGTIVRLAAAFDAAGVLLLPGCADAFGPKAIRSSAGAILTVPVASATARHLRDRTLVVADMHGDHAQPPARDAVLVFGNEGSGVSVELRRVARAISIPMSERVESLNVAASAAILLSQSYATRIK